MNEVTSRGIHKPQELSVCLSHVATKPGQRLAPFSILESFLCRRERAEGNKLSVGRENGVSAVFSLLGEKNGLHGDSRCSLKWASWYFNPLYSVEKR